MSGSVMTDLHPFVERLQLHSCLSAQEQQAILQLSTRTVQVAAHRDFVRLGERLDHACLVVDGLAARFGQNADGLRQITALHIPGDMADLHSVVLPDAISGIQALATTTLLMVPHGELRNAANTYPAIAEAFWRHCMIEVSILSQWVVNVGRRDARTRIAHLLCEMAVRCGSSINRQCSYTLRVTQAHLADATALTPVHVNRTLKSLREQGLVVLRSNEVRILDWERLRDLAEFDPAYINKACRKAEKDSRHGPPSGRPRERAPRA